MTHKRSLSIPKIALYEPDIPQNTAAIIRTCSCLGAFLEIIEPCGFLFNDKRFKRVVMDYLDESMIKTYNSADEFFTQKKSERIILMTTKAKKKYNNFRIKKKDTLLSTNSVINTNFCEISVCKSKQRNKAIIVCVIDNLIKGGAGQAVQNLNILYNFKSYEGFK